jgi:hypothetical protein
MSRNYKFHNPEGLYFISCAIVGCLDVFTRNEYKYLFLESVAYCQKKKARNSCLVHYDQSCTSGV